MQTYGLPTTNCTYETYHDQQAAPTSTTMIIPPSVVATATALDVSQFNAVQQVGIKKLHPVEEKIK